MHPFWKHSFPSEPTEASEESIASWIDARSDALVVVVSRHPALWLESCLMRSAADLFTRRAIGGTEDEVISGLAALYDSYGRAWIELSSQRANVVLQRYEDALKNIWNHPQLSMVTVELRDDKKSVKKRKIPFSVKFSEHEVQDNINYVCRLDVEKVESLFKGISVDVLSKLGYSKDQLNFLEVSERASARSKLYKLKGLPAERMLEAVSANDLSMLVKHFPDDVVVMILDYVKGNGKNSELFRKAKECFEKELASNSLSSYEAAIGARLLFRSAHWGPAEELLALLSKRRPDDYEVAILSAQVQRGKGSVDEAEAMLRAFLAAHEPDADWDGPSSDVATDRLENVNRSFACAMVRCELAQLLIGKGDVAKALRLIEATLQHEPNLYWAHQLRAVALQRLGDLNEARTAIETSIRLNPGGAPARAILADILRSSGATREALVEIGQALKAEPGNKWFQRLQTSIENSAQQEETQERDGERRLRGN